MKKYNIVEIVKLKNAKNREFVKEVVSILKKNKELLVLLWYNLGSGNKDFYLIRNEENLIDLIHKANSYDELTIFKSHKIIYENKTDKVFVEEIENILKESIEGFFLIVWEAESLEEQEWSLYDENEIDELKEEINDTHNKKFKILVEPDWLKEKEFIRAYAPDKNGEVVRGKY